MKTLYKIDEAITRIKSGATFMVAGEESLLIQLPKGNWIGGTIPYFMSENGGVTTRDLVQLQEIPAEAKVVSQKIYKKQDLPHLTRDFSVNGFSLIILPGLSDIHLEFGRDVYNYENIYNRPLAGWVSGVHLENIGKHTPKVFNGITGEVTDESAVVMHLELPPKHFAKLETLNLFKQGNGDVIEFTDSGFRVINCLVNGKLQKFSDYLKKIQFDIKLPLVANYSGAFINVSIQSIDELTGAVNFYNAVQKNVVYKFAKTLDTTYSSQFDKIVDKRVKPLFCCNCVLNYLYDELEGKSTGQPVGPMSFGEVAYVLHNQTMVYLTIEKN